MKKFRSLSTHFTATSYHGINCFLLSSFYPEISPKPFQRLSLTSARSTSEPRPARSTAICRGTMLAYMLIPPLLTR
jgi:hypothetical protein